MMALKKRGLAINMDAALTGREDEEVSRLPALENAVRKYNDADGYARAIGKLWAEAQQKFIAIGRHLQQAKQTLAHGDYERMVSSMLPFGPSVARKLRTVAEAVDSGRLPGDSLPNAYSVAYELAVLPEGELLVAGERRLIRPDVTRREIEAFKREIRNAQSDRRAVLALQRNQQMARLRAARAKVQEIEAAIAELEAQMDAEGGAPIIDGQAEEIDDLQRAAEAEDATSAGAHAQRVAAA